MNQNVDMDEYDESMENYEKFIGTYNQDTVST